MSMLVLTYLIFILCTLNLSFSVYKKRRRMNICTLNFWMTKSITYFLLIGDGSLFYPVEKTDDFIYYLRCNFFPYGNYSQCQFFRSNEDFQPYWKQSSTFFFVQVQNFQWMNRIHTYLLQLIASLKPSDMNFLYKAKLIQQANFTRQPSSLFIWRQYISRVPIKTDVLLFT